MPIIAYMPNTLQYPQIRTFIRRDKVHSRLKTRPLARAAKRREETITLENMIFEKGREG